MYRAIYHFLKSHEICFTQNAKNKSFSSCNFSFIYNRYLKEYARLWNFNVEFENLTDEMACLSVAGPLSRSLLSKLTTEDISNKSFPFLSAKNMSIAGIPTRAMRITYTGKLSCKVLQCVFVNY